MRSYAQLIETFMNQDVPLSVNSDVRFENVVASIFGTKQRRYGPMPEPEVQVAVRNIVRESGDNLVFFMPWGSRKQNDGQGLDVMEFMALRQLYCLQQELGRYDVTSRFVFRLEDQTDRYLFGDTHDTVRQSNLYIANFKALAGNMLRAAPGGMFQLESQHIDWKRFKDAVDGYAPVFFRVLQGLDPLDVLKEIDWTGTLPSEQREYYASAYRGYWPQKNPDEINWEMAKYFAATLARVKFRATGAPPFPHILIAFTHPVPGNPVAKTRIHYRSIPAKYTNNHRSPWIGKGYFAIGDDNSVTPKSAGVNERLWNLNKQTIRFGDADIEADYLLT